MFASERRDIRRAESDDRLHDLRHVYGSGRVAFHAARVFALDRAVNYRRRICDESHRVIPNTNC